MNDPNKLGNDELKEYAADLYHSVCYFQARAQPENLNPVGLSYAAIWRAKLLKQVVEILKNRESPLDEATLVCPYHLGPDDTTAINEICTRFGHRSGP